MQAKTWIDAAQNELKSIKNPMKLGKLRKSLSGGMSIAKAIPKFLKALGKSSKGVFSFAKKQSLCWNLNIHKKLVATTFLCHCVLKYGI